MLPFYLSLLIDEPEKIKRMAQMARAQGRSLGLSDSQLQDLELLANMHDIGKIIPVVKA